MLFCKAVVLVEGITELLLLPQLAEHLRLPLDNSHAGIIRVDGVTFKHFLKLFGVGGDPALRRFALPRRLACLLDADPSRVEGGTSRSCWPFQLTAGDSPESHVVRSLKAASKASRNVKVFSGKPGKSKTFEYDLMFENPGCDLVLTDSCQHLDRLKELATATAPCRETLVSVGLDESSVNDLEGCTWSEGEKKQASVAACYLLSLTHEKGEHAMKVAQALRERLDEGRSVALSVPNHVEQAIRWVSSIGK